MEHLNKSACGELLAQGQVTRADTFPCGHVILTFDSFKIGFAPEDFRDFAHTIALAQENLRHRETERADWGLYM